MNILTIGTTDTLGGAAKISWSIKTALEQTGHTTSMLVADKRSADENVRVIPRVFWRKLADYVLNTETFVSTDWILQTKEFQEADVVHCHNLHGRYFNLRTLQKISSIKPVVWTLHDEWAITPHCACTLQGKKMKDGLFVCPSNRTEPKIFWKSSRHLCQIKNTVYKNSTLNIVSPSKWLLERVKKTTLSSQPQYHIPNGINTKNFSPTPQSEARQKLNLPMDKKIVLFLAVGGKSNTWKGWVHTEKIINKYHSRSDVLFLNVGNFTKEASGVNTEYRPHVSSESELALYYSASDVLLFTSIAENFPLVILEAMSCGLPIVSFDVGGVAEVLEHGQNGWIARYKNTDDLNNNLRLALALTTEERAAMSARSSEKIKATYDTTNMTNAYLKLYQELLKPNYDKIRT